MWFLYSFLFPIQKKVVDISLTSSLMLSLCCFFLSYIPVILIAAVVRRGNDSRVSFKTRCLVTFPSFFSPQSNKKQQQQTEKSRWEKKKRMKWVILHYPTFTKCPTGDSRPACKMNRSLWTLGVNVKQDRSRLEGCHNNPGLYWAHDPVWLDG